MHMEQNSIAVFEFHNANTCLHVQTKGHQLRRATKQATTAPERASLPDRQFPKLANDPQHPVAECLQGQ